jgi:hypothetical protein
MTLSIGFAEITELVTDTPSNDRKMQRQARCAGARDRSGYRAANSGTRR